jgi:hypothetical protein
MTTAHEAYSPTLQQGEEPAQNHCRIIVDLRNADRLINSVSRLIVVAAATAAARPTSR